MWNTRKTAVESLFLIFLLTRGVKTHDFELYGLGASLPGEVYEAWAPAFENYRNRFVSLNNEYAAQGSGIGKATITGKIPNPDVSYVGTDSVLTEEEHADNPDLQMVPILGAAVVLAYNLLVVDNLNLTTEHMVGIYNGTFTWWNDTSIQLSNPDAIMPRAKIRVVARADDAGTTEIFTAALCKFDPAWNSTYGRFSDGLDEYDQPVWWNSSAIELYGRTNRGVSGIVLSYRYSIGYMSVADAQVAQMKYATIINHEGKGLDVDPEVLLSVMDRSSAFLGSRLTLDLIDFVEDDEYPIIGYSYFVVKMHEMEDCDLGVELVRYMEWIVEDDFTRDEIQDFKMAPIPFSVVDIMTERVLKEMTCRGMDLYEMAQDQKHEEWLSLQTWRLPVAIATLIAGLLVLALLVYIVVQQVRLRRAMNSDDWKIESDTINLKWSKKWGLVGTGQSALSLTVSAISHVTLTQTGGHLMGIGVWGDKPVCLREVLVPSCNMGNREVQRTLLWMRYKIVHNNVLKLFGVTRVDNELFFVSEHAQKGTLSDVIQNEKYRIDDNIKFSLAMDVANGMSYLHGQGLLHGFLKSESCFLDQRWNVKIADWENDKLEQVNRVKKLSKVAPVNVDDLEIQDPNIAARHLYWTDPELLRSEQKQELQKYMDVYSFAIILVEVFTREDPFSEKTSMEPTDIIEAIKEKELRPDLEKITPHSIRPIIAQSWDPDPEKRPSFSQLKRSLRSIRPSKKNVMDSMMEALEGYVNQLEEKVAERTAELATANQQLEHLLHQILPPSVADSLSRGESVQPETFESVTIFFSDIVGFTKLSAASKPMEIVNMLNDLYTTFDSVIDNHDVYKVETIGDAYMVISGLPTRNGDMHASHIATMALDLIAASRRFKVRHRPKEKLSLRAGVHSGPVVAGVVGLKMPRYCLFGDTVNTASRMESTSTAMKIQVSQTTEELLKKLTGFKLEYRGENEVKGKGKMKTYFLEGKTGYNPLPASGSYCLNFLNDE